VHSGGILYAKKRNIYIFKKVKEISLETLSMVKKYLILSFVTNFIQLFKNQG
jgi:hypothetical protein